jgi:hypothetical protein
MRDSIRIWPMRPDDSEALTALEDATVDGGLVSFLTRYKHDYYAVQQALRPDFAGLERKQANLAWCSFDRQGPLSRAISLPRFPPPAGGSIVIHSSPALRDDRVLYANTMMA